MISKKTSKYYDLTFYHIISKHNYCFTFTRNRDQNLLVTICSINIVLHSKSFKYSLNILTNRNSHETSISIKVPFFLKQFHFQGGEANKRYPCKLCYSFPFKPPKVIKHCVVPEYVRIPPHWKFLRVAVVSKAKNSKEKYGA